MQNPISHLLPSIAIVAGTARVFDPRTFAAGNIVEICQAS